MSTVFSTHWGSVAVVGGTVSGLPESSTESSSIDTGVRTVVVNVSGNSKSSMDVPSDAVFSVSVSGAKLTISPLVSIGIRVSSAIADTGSRVITMHSARNILSILLFIGPVPP